MRENWSRLYSRFLENYLRFTMTNVDGYRSEGNLKEFNQHFGKGLIFILTTL